MIAPSQLAGTPVPSHRASVDTDQTQLNVSLPPPQMGMHPSDPGGSSILNELPSVPLHIPTMSDPLSSLPFPIDASQIDPQLMIPPNAGLLPFPPEIVQQSIPPAGAHPSEAHNDTVPSKTSNPRRASRKRAEPRSDSGLEDGTTREYGRARMPSVHLTSFSEGENTNAAPTKKRRSRRADADGDENEVEPSSKRQRTTGSRRGRTRLPSPPPFDPDADPGEELDPTVVTMAALCDDTGRGRVSSKASQIVSNHAAWRASNREKRARMKAIMEAKKYGRDLEAEEDGVEKNETSASQGDTAASASQRGTPAPEVDPSNAAQDETADKGAEFNYGENLAISRFNVQVRIGANGETIIDEDSLFVNRDEGDQTENYTHVEESDFTKFVNSATYSRKVRGSRWSAEETELFYNVGRYVCYCLLCSVSYIDNLSGIVSVWRKLRTNIIRLTWPRQESMQEQVQV